MLRRVLLLAALALAGCSAAEAQSAGCHVDSDCTLVDHCGCSCSAILGPAPPPAPCSAACGGHPCVGHRAACVRGSCVMR